MTQVFGVDGVGSERLGGDEDRRVPIGNGESLGFLDSDSHYLMVNGLTGKSSPLLNPVPRLARLPAPTAA
jgi:hypothetical protein